MRRENQTTASWARILGDTLQKYQHSPLYRHFFFFPPSRFRSFYQHTLLVSPAAPDLCRPPLLLNLSNCVFIWPSNHLNTNFDSLDPFLHFSLPLLTKNQHSSTHLDQKKEKRRRVFDITASNFNN